MAKVPVPTKKRIGAAYCRLLEEILIRDELLHNVFTIDIPSHSGRLMPDMGLRAKVEFSYLQLRKICELLALACLTAHGEILGAAQLRDEYDADTIIKRLDELHPDFYPKPSHKSLAKNAKGQWDITPITSGFLTKSELLSLYGRCSNYLHAGTVAKIRAGKSPSVDPQEPKRWADKIWTLLEHHEIQTVHPTVKLYVLMKEKIELRPQVCFSTLQPDGIWIIDPDGISRATG